jgi:hypothetical protein
MASGTLYTARLVGPEIIEAGRDNAITCPVYRDGALVAPTQAGSTISVWNATGTKIVDGAAVTVASSVASYTVTSATLSGQTKADGWRIEWALLISGTVYTFRRDAVLVYRQLYPVVTDADLLRLHTDLARRMPSTESSYQDYLDEAWATLEGRLVATGKRPWLVLAPSALREVHLYSTLARIFRDFAQGGPGTAEWELALDYDRRQEAAWSQLTFPQASQEGTPEDARRRRAGMSSLWLAGRP